ncbi:MAG TPA: tetratricopeptide repeat protein [Caulobacteraceae bacterium]
MRIRLWTAATAIGALVGGGAHAAMTVFGGGMAQACSQAAIVGKSDLGSIQLCDYALDSEVLQTRDRAGTYINRGVMKLRRRAYEQARADFNIAIAIAPTIGEGWINRGAVFVGERRYRDGLSDLSKGIELGVKEPEKAYYNRALAEEGLDDEKAAYLDYQQAVTLKPGWAPPQQELLRFTVTRR